MAGNCSTYHCYKGGPEEPPAGLETDGCPLYSHPAQLTDNRNCVLCMECNKVPPLHVSSSSNCTRFTEAMPFLHVHLILRMHLRMYQK